MFTSMQLIVVDTARAISIESLERGLHLVDVSKETLELFKVDGSGVVLVKEI